VKVGVVVWVEGTTVKFRINEGVLVERGQLLKVEDRGVKFILRVYDFKPESLLTPAEIARISRKRELGEELALYDRGLRLYDTALATIVVQVDEDGVSRGPSSVPSIFSVVETLDKIDLEQLRLDTGDLGVGWVRVGHKVTDVPVLLDGGRVFPHHILICGVTGSGKSNLGRVLAYSVMKADGRYSLILFDCESEYFKGSNPSQMGLVHAAEAEERLFYVTGEIDEPTRIKYEFWFKGVKIERSVAAHPLEVSYEALHPADFTLTGEFTGPQEELLWLAWQRFGKEWLSTLLNTPSSTLYARLGRLAHTNTINTVKRKLRHLLGSGDIFKEYCSTNLLSAVLGAVGKGMVVLFDMPYATEGEEKLLATAVARRVFRAYERLRKESPSDWEQLPYVMIAVEEAHRYLSKTALLSGGELRENIFSIICKRGRKYKVGGMYITQMPGELIEPVLRQTLTKIILPLPTRPDYSRVVEYTPYLEDAEQEIKTLDRGEALIVSPVSGLRFAVPIKVFQYEEAVAEEIDAEVSLVSGRRTSRKSLRSTRL